MLWEGGYILAQSASQRPLMKRMSTPCRSWASRSQHMLVSTFTMLMVAGVAHYGVLMSVQACGRQI